MNASWPVTKLYDRGTTVMPAELLHERIGEATIVLHPEAAQNLGVEAGQTVNVSFNGFSGEAVVKLDDTISASVALVRAVWVLRSANLWLCVS